MAKTAYNRQVIAWAFYDWANSAFAVVVLAGFFPIFFRDFWASGQASHEITFQLGLANSLSSLVIVFAAPLLGAVGDRAGIRKRLLMFCATLGILATASFFWIPMGEWQLAAAMFTLGAIGFMGANVFYDSLLVSVTERQNYDQVSALGYSLGYLGGGLLFALCVYMTLQPAVFGLANAAAAVKLSFLITAAWWLLFSLPLLLLVEESATAKPVPILTALGSGYRQLRETFRHIRQLRPVWMFLLAYWLYIDGVDTIIRMAVDYGRALGLEQGDLITALLITQFVGFPAAIAFGLLGARIGTRNGILIGIAAYCLITLGASQMQSASGFYALAIAVGLVQGGIQSLSRAYYARLIPAAESAEFFGFYNMLGKFAAVFGPLMVGWIGVLSGSPRVGILSLLILFIAGGAVLLLSGQPDETAK